jgi:hypothetical protein
MRYEQIVRSLDGTLRHITNVEEVKIPDLWHVSQRINKAIKGEQGVLSALIQVRPH